MATTWVNSLTGLAYPLGFQPSNILSGFYMKGLNHQIVCLLVWLFHLRKCKYFLALEGGKGLCFCFSFLPPSSLTETVDYIIALRPVIQVFYGIPIHSPDTSLPGSGLRRSPKPDQ